MSTTPICPNCKTPYVPLSKEDERQLALAKEYELACPVCFVALGKDDSTPEPLFDQLNLERSYYLVLIQTLGSIETAHTLLEICEDLRSLFAPDSRVRYAWANVAPHLLRQLWAVMAKIGGTVPLQPDALNGQPRVSEPFIQDVLRGLDDVVRWCEQKLSTSGNPAGTIGHADGPTMEGVFFKDGVRYSMGGRDTQELLAKSAQEPQPQTIPEPPAAQPNMEQQMQQLALAVGDKTALRILAIAQRSDLSGEQKMNEILHLDHRFAAKNSNDWATLLGVSSSAVRGYSLWKRLQAGKRAEE